MVVFKMIDIPASLRVVLKSQSANSKSQIINNIKISNIVPAWEIGFDAFGFSALKIEIYLIF